MAIIAPGQAAFVKAKNSLKGIADKTQVSSDLFNKAKNRLSQLAGGYKSQSIAKLNSQLPPEARGVLSTLINQFGAGAENDIMGTVIENGKTVKVQEDNKSHIDKFTSSVRDLVRPNLFIVEFSTGADTDQKIELLCKSTSLVFPTFTEGITRYNNNNFKSASGVDKDPINMGFYMDTENIVMNMFLEWYNLIWNFETKTHGYPADYKFDATVRIFDRRVDKDDAILAVKYIGIYPTNIGDIEFAWESTDAVQEVSITFNYDDMEIVEIKK